MVATIAVPYSRLADYNATMGIPFFEQTRDFFELLVRSGRTWRSFAQDSRDTRRLVKTLIATLRGKKIEA